MVRAGPVAEEGGRANDAGGKKPTGRKNRPGASPPRGVTTTRRSSERPAACRGDAARGRVAFDPRQRDKQRSMVYAKAILLLLLLCLSSVRASAAPAQQDVRPKRALRFFWPPSPPPSSPPSSPPSPSNTPTSGSPLPPPPPPPPPQPRVSFGLRRSGLSGGS